MSICQNGSIPFIQALNYIQFSLQILFGEFYELQEALIFIREQQAQLLVLDEPTAALDPRSEYEIYSRFSELVRGN